jgi:hypothetical protein
VLILGLFRADLQDYNDETVLKKEFGDIWTLNDWYRCYPWLVHPDLIINLHRTPFPKTLDHRYPGDPVVKYAESGACIVHHPDYPINMNHAFPLPLDELKERFPVHRMNCAISTLIYLAILANYENIALRGVLLRETEYQYQVRSVLDAINVARAVGIKVDNPREREWMEMFDLIDWANIPEGWYYTEKWEVNQVLDMSVDLKVPMGKDTLPPPSTEANSQTLSMGTFK